MKKLKTGENVRVYTKKSEGGKNRGHLVLDYTGEIVFIHRFFIGVRTPKGYIECVNIAAVRAGDADIREGIAKGR